MATILKFRQPRDEVRRRIAESADRGCEIVLFPGVRYERRSEPQSSPPRSVSPVRDILTLID
jgi:hypothetical protein